MLHSENKSTKFQASQKKTKNGKKNPHDTLKWTFS